MGTPYKYIPIISSIYRFVKRHVNNIVYYGDNVFCPVCLHSFRAWINNQDNGACPYCKSETRQRLLCTYLDTEYQQTQCPAKVLYFAPTFGQERWFRRQTHRFNCITTDISAPNVDYHSDITNLQFESDSFDIVACCHVLEHIPEDNKAIEEIYRILRRNGTAFIQVPYNRDAEHTDEDPTVVDPSERTKRWGQFDHVRLYGKDIIERLRKSGFQVDVIDLSKRYNTDDNKRLGFWDDLIFVCQKI